MPAPRPVPAALALGPFTVHEADALGVTASQRRRRRYGTVSRGVHEVVRGGQDTDPSPAGRLTARARPVLRLTPHAVVGHAGAGLLWGLRLPRRMQDPEPLHLTRADDGVVCEHRHGLRSGIPPLLARPELIRSLDRWPGHRGVRRLRTAVELSVPGADSAPETELRLLLQEHGIAGLALDLRIVAPDGTEVLPDIAVEAARVSVQDEGAHHDRPGQREIDIRRQRRTQAAGWTEVRITQRDLVDHVVTGPGREGPGARYLPAGAGTAFNDPVTTPSGRETWLADVAEAGTDPCEAPGPVEPFPSIRSSVQRARHTDLPQCPGQRRQERTAAP
ncbi:hypothetical protein ACH9EU_15780 [Kocuria sp. M1R5S2]|uniref:hypothetical protein n=1 Tax=Kocuria rhizosphaerae TaxID=3376285 RepID=UPI0037B9E74A